MADPYTANKSGIVNWAFPQPDRIVMTGVKVQSINMTLTHDKVFTSSMSPVAIGMCFGVSTQCGCGSFGLTNLGWYDGIDISDTEGSPAVPSLKLRPQYFFRFKWSVRIGNRKISVRVKQVSDGGLRPTMTIKAYSGVGISSDIVTTAAAGTDWVTIGPVTITPTNKGVVYVELKNNSLLTSTDDSTSAYFDHIVVT